VPGGNPAGAPRRTRSIASRKTKIESNSRTARARSSLVSITMRNVGDATMMSTAAEFWFWHAFRELAWERPPTR
jgi:hypothetical protein